MKKYAITLAAFLLLTGCGSTKNEKKASNETETTSVTNAVTTETTTAKTTAKTTTTTVSAAAKKTTAKTTAAKTTSATTAAPASTTSAVNNSEANDNTAGNTPAPQPAEKHYTLYGEEISEAEWNAIGKVKSKYGIDCEVLARNLCWEKWPKVILNDDGTRRTIPVEKRDPNEPLDVVYVLKDSDGVVFEARIKDNTDIITHDTYVYDHYREQLHNEAAGSIKKLVPGGKILFNGGDYGELPFESPSEMTYDEFRQAFADNGGSVFGWVYVTEGMEVSDELKAYSPRRGDGHSGEFGYVLKFHVLQVSQEDYDRLEDVSSDQPGPRDTKILN